MSHVRNFDIRFALVVGVMVGAIAILADFFLDFTFWGGGRRSSSREGGGVANATTSSPSRSPSPSSRRSSVGSSSSQSTVNGSTLPMRSAELDA